MNVLRSRFGVEGKQHARPAVAEIHKCSIRHVTSAITGTNGTAAGCVQQQQHSEQQQLLPAQPTPPHMRALSLTCACLVAMDSGLPLVALADVPQQQQQQQSEKHGLLSRLRQMVKPAGDGECSQCYTSWTLLACHN